MNEPYFKRLRRLLLLMAEAGRAGERGRGVPLARAVEVTGARSQAEVIADVEAVRDLYELPGEGALDLAIDLSIEDGEVFLSQAYPFGSVTAFTLAEGAVLLAALAPFEKDGARPVKRAAAELRASIPRVLRAEAEQLAAGLDMAVAPPEPWAGVLQEAIDKRLEVTVQYRAVSDGRVVPRVVEPRVLFQRDGQWYLAAWSVAKGEEHLFRLDRIEDAIPGTRVFGEHKGPPTDRYRARNLFFASGAEREVAVRYSGVAARHARRRGGRLREHADGTVTARFKVAPGDYLLGVILGLGGEATIEGPPDVAARLEARLDELERLYAR